MSETILGVDLGTARIGIAICEGAGLPAVPLTTIPHTTWRGDVEAVASLASARGAQRIVVGNPIAMDGTSGPAAQRVAAFIADLRPLFAGQVVSYDERFTTAIAQQRLRDLPMSGSKRRRHVDELAAVEILSAYLAQGRQ
ncbi:MAG: Holliday junction resolvase RuvX [Candidatus Eremiobacteraeota bacterium]|nr:Holliday junction resolvase RuvX [Candidatus Eremiobacteraeota bacterium]